MATELVESEREPENPEHQDDQVAGNDSCATVDTRSYYHSDLSLLPSQVRIRASPTPPHPNLTVAQNNIYNY